jgi:hypothetical protein
MTDEADKPIRLTETVRRQLLEGNEGFARRTHYEAKNFTETRDYRIEDGELFVRSRGKTSWADSGFDTTNAVDPEATHRFLRENRNALDWAGVDPDRKIPKPAPAVASTDDVEAIFEDDRSNGEASEDEQGEVTWGPIVGLAVVVGFVFRKPIARKLKQATAAVRARLRKESPSDPVEIQEVDDSQA